jgi:hypothetical protein
VADAHKAQPASTERLSTKPNQNRSAFSKLPNALARPLDSDSELDVRFACCTLRFMRVPQTTMQLIRSRALPHVWRARVPSARLR